MSVSLLFSDTFFFLGALVAAGGWKGDCGVVGHVLFRIQASYTDVFSSEVGWAALHQVLVCSTCALTSFSLSKKVEGGD